MKKISTRQLIIFYCIYSFSIKFLALPQLLATHSAQDAWIAAIIGTVIELLLLYLAINVLVLRKDHPKWNIWIKPVLVLMFAMFLLQLFIIMGTSHTLVTQNLFHGLGRQTFFIPLVLFGMMFCFVSARAIFRSGEIFYLLIILGLALSVIPAIPKMQPSMVTPIFESGFGGIWASVFRNLIFFESTAFLLTFSGEIKITKDFRKKFMTIATLVGAVFVFFVFITITIFGPLTVYQNIAIIDLATNSSFFRTGGRIDWILVCIWLLLLMLRFGVTFYCAFICIRYLFNIKHRATYIGMIIAASMWATWTFAIINTARLDRFIHLSSVAIAITVLVIPIACFVHALVTKRRTKNA